MIRFGNGFGFYPTWGAIVGLVLFALMVASIVWLIVVLVRGPRRGWWSGPSATGAGWYGAQTYRSPALDELDVAYARGQLSREEYFRRRADLTGWSPPGPGRGGPGGGPAPTPPATPTPPAA